MNVIDGIQIAVYSISENTVLKSSELSMCNASSMSSIGIYSVMIITVVLSLSMQIASRKNGTATV